MKPLILPFIVLLLLFNACKKEDQVVCNRFEELYGIYETDAFYVFSTDTTSDTVPINYFAIYDYKLNAGPFYPPSSNPSYNYTCHFIAKDSFTFNTYIPGIHIAHLDLELNKIEDDTFFFSQNDSSGIIAKFHPNSDYLWYKERHCYRRN